MVAYSFKTQFERPIRVGLSRVSLSFDPPPKCQTIRFEGSRRHARPTETIQLYVGMRTKQCRKIGEARCVSVEPILIWTMEGRIEVNSEDIHDIDAFAQSDGFGSWAEMKAFWRQNHGDGPFVGLLIKWEPL